MLIIKVQRFQHVNRSKNNTHENSKSKQCIKIQLISLFRHNLFMTIALNLINITFSKLRKSESESRKAMIVFFLAKKNKQTE